MLRTLVTPRRVGLGALALATVAAGVPRAFSAPDLDLDGTWDVTGKNTKAYTGTATVTHSGDEYTIAFKVKYADGVNGTARFIGKMNGPNMLLGRRQITTGLAGALGGIGKKGSVARYTLSADGLKLDGIYSYGYRETLKKKAEQGGKAKLTVDADRDGKLAEADRTAASQDKSALLTLVPGKPDSVVAPLKVEVTEGKVKLEVSPAGSVKLFKGNAEVTELGVGTHELKVQPVTAGTSEVRLLSGTTVVDKAKIAVENEKLYLILFGYMGAEENYLSGDLQKCKSYIMPKLKGYTLLEDGSGYNQGTIDQGLSDPRASKKVIVDWCVTTADWEKYFSRHSVRGYAWSSHGFMEPFPGCPDSEIKTFEARQWTCAEGSPASTGNKHFIRQWRAHFEKNVPGHMDFALNHSCATGGLGADYSHEPWEYCTPETKARAEKLFNPLPTFEQLTFTTHGNLKGFFDFQQNYDGSAYFGMNDVRWSSLVGSIKP